MTINTAKLISVTPDAEKHMAFCARVSNPKNQENENFSGLLKYCVKHQHWSLRYTLTWMHTKQRTLMTLLKITS